MSQDTPITPGADRSETVEDQRVETGSQADVVPVGAVDLGLTPVVTGHETIGVRKGAFGAAGSGDTSGFGGLVAPIAMPGPSARPFGGDFDAVADELELALADAGLPMDSAIEKVVVDRGELTLYVQREHLEAVGRTLRDEPGLRFEICHSVSGVHYPGDQGRELHAVIHLLSITHKRRIRLEVACPDQDPHVPSLTAVWPSADWHERETWDMFGIVFDGHPSLTRILMPDDWPGHPQRKDYPLGGIPVEYKGATTPPPDQRRGYS
ncbi:MAG: NADH-quinone oxidoreductase subunit C [Candidatus Nanopelagicales bacterium]|nr:NADH-quinone oxidoreductase subunit C [Candidatus Nanopelagicales bacterium]